MPSKNLSSSLLREDTFSMWTSPLSSSNNTKSTNIPPTSIASRWLVITVSPLAQAREMNQKDKKDNKKEIKPAANPDAPFSSKRVTPPKGKSSGTSRRPQAPGKNRSGSVTRRPKP